jgi:hypothetical protein
MNARHLYSAAFLFLASCSAQAWVVDRRPGGGVIGYRMRGGNSEDLNAKIHGLTSCPAGTKAIFSGDHLRSQSAGYVYGNHQAFEIEDYWREYSYECVPEYKN